MHKDITIEEALNTQNAQFVDIRSPREFAEACIPGAVNIPLLDDAEREIVGTVYKQESPEKARTEALSLVSPKLPGVVDEFRKIAHEKQVIVYCWRGGMRSNSVASFLDIMGIPSKRLAGGFKAYRKHVNDYFSRDIKHRVLVLHGLTGVGKTEVIYKLKELGVATIDLEGLANNRGSVFGNVGMKPQPSQKMFEGLLAEELKQYEPEGYVIVEGESRRIGRLTLPESLFKAMNSGTNILLYCSMEKRIERIKEIYTEGPGQNIEALIRSVGSLVQRLGTKRVRQLQEMIEVKNFDETIRFLLVDYYDPLYKYPDRPDDNFDLSIDSEDPSEAAGNIKEFLEKR